MKKLSHGLSGSAGQFYVAAELSQRGFLATLTNKNAETIDILAARPDAGKAIKIQVKTSQGSKKKWLLRKKDETLRGDGFFYVFVSMNAVGIRPDFYVVPADIIAVKTAQGHKDWLLGSKRNGQPRKDTDFRGFGAESQYKEAWHILASESC
jgi:hypothetical protein